jgi:hypothetical protein
VPTRTAVTVAEYTSQAARLAHVQDLLAAALAALRGLPEGAEHTRATLSVVSAQRALHRLHDELDAAVLVPDHAQTELEYPDLVKMLVAALRPN